MYPSSGTQNGYFSPTTISIFRNPNINTCVTGGGTPVTPTTPPPPAELQNGIPITGLSGASAETIYFSLTVPFNSDSVVCSISGGSGDADLYTKWDAPVDTDNRNNNAVCAQSMSTQFVFCSSCLSRFAFNTSCSFRSNSAFLGKMVTTRAALFLLTLPLETF